MFKMFKELSFSYFIVFLALLMAATLTMKGIIEEWNISILIDRIVITRKWAIFLPFSISYSWNILIAAILSILFYFLLPKNILCNPKRHGGSKYSLVIIFVVSLVMLVAFNSFVGFVTFFVTFHVACLLEIMGIIEIEHNLEDLDNHFLYAEAPPPEDLFEFDCRLAQEALNRYSIVTFFLFSFSICLLKGIATGIFFALAFVFLSFAFGLTINALSSKDDKKIQKEISIVTEN